MLHCEQPGARDIRGWRERCCPPGRDLIHRKIYKHVLIAPVAISGTYLEEWRRPGGKTLRSLSWRYGACAIFILETPAVLWPSRQAQTSVGAWIFYRTRSLMAGGFASWRSSTISLLNA